MPVVLSVAATRVDGDHQGALSFRIGFVMPWMSATGFACLAWMAAQEAKAHIEADGATLSDEEREDTLCASARWAMRRRPSSMFRTSAGRRSCPRQSSTIPPENADLLIGAAGRLSSQFGGAAPHPLP